MRTIEQTTQFRRDYKREARGHYRATLDLHLVALFGLFIADAELLDRHVDHGLGGRWSGYRDCHVHPELVRTPAAGSEHPDDTIPAPW